MSFFCAVDIIQSSKKSLFHATGYSDYQYEYTYHYARLNNSYYQTLMWFCDRMGVCCNSPYWEERG